MIKLERYQLDSGPVRRRSVVPARGRRWCVRVRHTKANYSFEGQFNVSRGDGRRTPWYSRWTPPSGHEHGRRSGAISKVRGTKGMNRDAVTAAAIRGHRGYVLASARATVPTQTPRTAWRAPPTRSGRGRRGTLVSGKVRGGTTT